MDEEFARECLRTHRDLLALQREVHEWLTELTGVTVVGDSAPARGTRALREDHPRPRRVRDAEWPRQRQGGEAGWSHERHRPRAHTRPAARTPATRNADAGPAYENGPANPGMASEGSWERGNGSLRARTR